MRPRTLDHVALWVEDRDSIAETLTGRVGMHVIDRTDAFTLLGWDAKRGKLTLFAADGPRQRGALKHVAMRADAPAERLELGEGLELHLVEDGEGAGDIDHVALYSAAPEASARAYLDLGFAEAEPGPGGVPRVEVAGAHVEFHEGEPGDPERPLLNHLAVLVDSAEEHRREAERLGIEVDDWVEGPNTLAVFLRAPERVRVEYVEHKPTFALT